MKMRLACVFALLLAAIPAQAAETPPIAAPARAAFEALPDVDRKALQEAMGWLGFYNGVVDGAFGKRTTDALAAYQQSVGAPSDGIVTQKGLAALKDGAAKAKAAVGFRVIDDPVTGLRIGAPMKLLEKHESSEGTAALVSKDGAVGLYFRETAGPLAALYKTLSADAGRRKVTYKVLKPDAFFVTAGEDGDNKFYRRYAAAPGGGDNAKLRGFAFIYPKARAKTLDPVTLAIANSFDPFPTPPPPVVAPAPPPPKPKLIATALVIEPGVAVTALDPAQCRTPTIAGKPAQYLDGGGPLVRLGGDFGAGAAAVPVGEAGDDLVALSLSASDDAAPALQVTAAASIPGAEGKVIAALGPAASGAPLFDRQARLVAFVAPVAAAERRAGVVLAAPHAILKAAALGGMSAGAGANLSAPAIARLRQSAIVGVFCAS